MLLTSSSSYPWTVLMFLIKFSTLLNSSSSFWICCFVGCKTSVLTFFAISLTINWICGSVNPNSISVSKASADVVVIFFTIASCSSWLSFEILLPNFSSHCSPTTSRNCLIERNTSCHAFVIIFSSIFLVSLSLRREV